MVGQQRLEIRQFIAILGVIVIHIELLLALRSGLSVDVIPELINSTQAIIIETIKPTPPVPKPVQPEISDPVVEPVPSR